jgi:hypothetical protein
MNIFKSEGKSLARIKIHFYYSFALGIINEERMKEEEKNNL